MFYKYRTFLEQFRMKSCHFVDSKFVCEICQYYTNKKSSYEKHMTTAKHNKMCESRDDDNANGTKLFKCEWCKKGFNARNTLWYHKKKCFAIRSRHNKHHDDSTDIDKKTVSTLLKVNGELKKLLNERTQEQKSMKDTIEKVQTESTTMHSQLLKAITEGRIGNITNIHNNQRFNLNLFLNEQCKDAMNIEDFIDSLKLEPYDIEETGRLGYVEGISRIFMSRLNELDLYSRPLHCTDLKRETLYIKEDNRWEKDNQNKEKLQRIVEKVAKKNHNQLPIWQQENPNHLLINTPECDQFMNIACNILGGGNEHETTKFRSQIMRNVLKEVTLTKL